jgi:hypothetical protein
MSGSHRRAGSYSLVLFAWALLGCAPQSRPVVVGSEPSNTLPAATKTAAAEGVPLPSSLGPGGDALLALAVGGGSLYWRVPGQVKCQAWKLVGDRQGALIRESPSPALELPYELDDDGALRIGSDEPVTGRVGEQGLSALCDDPLVTAAPQGAAIPVGEGSWYSDRAACEASGARSVPAACASKLAWLVQSRSGEPDLLRYVYDKNGPLLTLDVDEQGALVCRSWRFRDGKLERRLRHDDASETVVSYRIARKGAERLTVSGPSYRDASGSMGGAGEPLEAAVEQVSRELYLIDGFPWLVNDEPCNQLLDIASRSN